jgi:O-antigen/teichoic acid export membrane protein
VNKKEQEDKFTSGKHVAKNTIYNLIGYGIPLLIALIVIPLLIKILGEERFGILNLVWIVIGYFSFFDFGIGRALTKVISEKIGANQLAEVPSIFWTSLLMMLFVSIIGTVILLSIIPNLVNNIFVISKDLQKESLSTFYVLTVSIPIVTTTAGLRGVLEAYQKFGVINIIRVLLGILTFLGPLLCLIFINSLFWVVVVLIVIRSGIWILYLIQCFRINPDLRKKITFFSRLIAPILKLSGWITVANLIAPFIIFSDRFLIGALNSATAVTYYATPYEIVTKLLLISGAIVAVLFPVFSASHITNPDLSKKLFLSGTKFIFLILYPIVLLIVTFSHEGLELWLGSNFADKSTLVLQLLSIGVLFNAMASIPFNFFQGIGKPSIPAIVNLIELPFYIFTMWYVIREWGINGAAGVWLLRILVDAGILFIIAQKKNDLFGLAKNKIILFVAALSVLVVSFVIQDITIKIIFVLIVLSVYTVTAWKHFLDSDEKFYVVSILRKVGNYS